MVCVAEVTQKGCLPGPPWGTWRICTFSFRINSCVCLVIFCLLMFPVLFFMLYFPKTSPCWRSLVDQVHTPNNITLDFTLDLKTQYCTPGHYWLFCMATFNIISLKHKRAELDNTNKDVWSHWPPSCKDFITPAVVWSRGVVRMFKNWRDSEKSIFDMFVSQKLLHLFFHENLFCAQATGRTFSHKLCIKLCVIG